LLELGLALRRERASRAPGIKIFGTGFYREQLRTSLPFTLTAAQEKVIREIEEDLCRGIPMNRLLQGDVGSGKTIVAAFAALPAVEEKIQVALMAPTEILAEQHYQNFPAYFGKLPVLRFADFPRDINMLKLARQEAFAVAKEDPNLTRSGHFIPNFENVLKKITFFKIILRFLNHHFCEHIFRRGASRQAPVLGGRRGPPLPFEIWVHNPGNGKRNVEGKGLVSVRRLKN
jgi:hypothetical protein